MLAELWEAQGIVELWHEVKGEARAFVEWKWDSLRDNNLYTLNFENLLSSATNLPYKQLMQ